MSEEPKPLTPKERRDLVSSILEKPWWTAEEAGIIMGRGKAHVERLFQKQILRRNAENLTCRAWVDEYLGKSIEGPRVSPVRRRKK